MPTTFERNLNLCFTKLKRHQSPPKTTTHHHHRRRHSEPTVIKNFNTLYDASDSDNPTTPPVTATATNLPTVIASDRFFFSSPGRSNSIIDSSSSSSTSFTPPEYKTPEYNYYYSGGGNSNGSGENVGGGVAVPTFSPDPYYDFRKSMQEMVEARDLIDVRANWDYLHELLTCYLELNPKSAHKFIVGAFADLLVSLMAEESSMESGSGGGGRNI